MNLDTYGTFHQAEISLVPGQLGHRATVPFRFIVLEGLDGSGKTAVAKALAQSLGAQYLATPVREFYPFRGAIDQVVGTKGLARTLWYATHVAVASRQVETILEAGGSVVLDRYWMSTFAYAAAQGCHLPMDDLLRHLVRPCATVLLNVPRELRSRRLTARQGRLDPHDLEFLDPGNEARLHAAYRQLATHPAAGRFVEIQLDEQSVDQDVETVLAALESVFTTIASN